MRRLTLSQIHDLEDAKGKEREGQAVEQGHCTRMLQDLRLI